jgi:hypothetical protein
MKLIYVAGPYRGATREEVGMNIAAARKVGQLCARKGWFPVMPQANTAGFEHLAPEITDEFWLAGTLELMRRCDAVVCAPGWEESKGSIDERAEASLLNLDVYDCAHQLPKLDSSA